MATTASANADQINAAVTHQGVDLARQPNEPQANSEPQPNQTQQQQTQEGNKANLSTPGQQKTSNPNNRTIGHYVVGKSLGQGTFGKVRLGTHILTGEKVAIKILEKDKILDKADVERVTREIQILKIVRHPNVIQLYEIIETNRQLFLIMEYASGGELFDYIVKRKRLQDKDAVRFFQQIISGIEYLHKIKVCHRDLKPENLLIDDNNNIKIVDFGLSNMYKTGETLKTACGSPCYAAPEMIAGKKYHGLMADIWSSGVILYAMACGYLPFEDPNTNKLYKKILNCDYLIPGFISPTCKELIKKILNTDPNQRLKLQEIRSHEWYVQIQSVELEGIVVGQDNIPVIEEVRMIMETSYSTQLQEVAELSEKYIKANKHNPITATYYLLMKKQERETGKNLVFERVTREKRSYNSTGNLVQKQPFGQTGMYFRGNSQQIGNAGKQPNQMNQTVMEGFMGKKKTDPNSSFNIGTSEFFNNLNPVTKQYLKQIEKVYRNDSIGSNPDSNNQDLETSKTQDKLKQFRDTVDVAKWIQSGYNKGQQQQQLQNNYGEVSNNSGANTSFMEQRLNRNNQLKQQQVSENRPTSNDNTKNYSIFQPNQFIKDILPNVSHQKQNQSKSMQYRLTMYNYNPANSSANQQQQQKIITQIQGNGAKFNPINFNSTKANFYDMNGRKVKNSIGNKSNIEVNDENQESKEKMHIQHSPPSQQNRVTNLKESIYNIYKTNSPQKGSIVIGNQSFLGHRNENSFALESNSNNVTTVVEKSSHNKLLSDLMQTAGRGFHSNNIPTKVLRQVQQQQHHQQNQVFQNSVILPFQVQPVMQGVKTTTAKNSIHANKINNDSNYNSTTDTSVQGGGMNSVQAQNLIKQINQNMLFSNKGVYKQNSINHIMACSCTGANKKKKKYEEDRNIGSALSIRPKKNQALQNQKIEIERQCGRQLGSSMSELYNQIQRFSKYATHAKADKRMMDSSAFKEILGLLGNFQISDRMFAAIDDDQDGLISLEDYLVYNDTIAHGTTQEKNFITFKMIDMTNSGRVSFEDFKKFWTYFIQLYGEALQTKLQCEEETIRDVFYQVSNYKETFDFPRFESAKNNHPELFEWLDQPGNYMQDIVNEKQKKQKVELQDFEVYNGMVMDAIDQLQEKIDELLGMQPSPAVVGGLPPIRFLRSTTFGPIRGSTQVQNNPSMMMVRDLKRQKSYFEFIQHSLRKSNVLFSTQARQLEPFEKNTSLFKLIEINADRQTEEIGLGQNLVYKDHSQQHSFIKEDLENSPNHQGYASIQEQHEEEEFNQNEIDESVSLVPSENPINKNIERSSVKSYLKDSFKKPVYKSRAVSMNHQTHRNIKSGQNVKYETPKDESSESQNVSNNLRQDSLRAPKLQPSHEEDKIEINLVKFDLQNKKDKIKIAYELNHLIREQKELLNEYFEEQKRQVMKNDDQAKRRSSRQNKNNHRGITPNPVSKSEKIDNGGQLIRIGHEKFDLILNIMIAIKKSLSNLIEIPFLELADRQFTLRYRFENQWISNQSQKKTDKLKDFLFFDYAPLVFQRIRRISEISDEDYLRSLGPDSILNCVWNNNYQSLYELCSSGKSGSLFYYTEDLRYMLKTISREEFKKLKSILKSYFNHIQNYPDTLVTRFYGLHKVQWVKMAVVHKKYLVVMNNIFRDMDVGLRFDLKGSTQGRRTLAQGDPLVKAYDNVSTALKDLDFIEHFEQVKLIRPKESNKQKVEDILERDAMFFAENHIIDYSILIGLLNQSQEAYTAIWSGEDKGQGVYFSEDGQAYVIGVIDILTEYNGRKKLEYLYKRLKYGTTMSCIPPLQYAQRFTNFMKKSIQTIDVGEDFAIAFKN